MQVSDSTVALVGHPLHQLPRFETLDDAGDCARMQVQYCGEVACGDPGAHADDPQREPLGAADADRILHPLRRAFERVLKFPDSLQEVQGRVESCGLFRRYAASGHGSYVPHTGRAPRLRGMHGGLDTVQETMDDAEYCWV